MYDERFFKEGGKVGIVPLLARLDLSILEARSGDWPEDMFRQDPKCVEVYDGKEPIGIPRFLTLIKYKICKPIGPNEFYIPSDYQWKSIGAQLVELIFGHAKWIDFIGWKTQVASKGCRGPKVLGLSRPSIFRVSLSKKI